MSIHSYKTLPTPINGLKIHLNKVVGDERGYFCDLAETDNPLFKTIQWYQHNIDWVERIREKDKEFSKYI